MKRVESLDYLRGLMTLSIMIFHYGSAVVGKFDSSTLLGKLGIYGVAIFYILSGLALTLNYKAISLSGVEFCSYAVKRIFRIVPLFWVSTTALIAMFYAGSLFGLQVAIPSLSKLIMNYTLSFSLLSPGAYISPGAWSIGNEVVFYIFFPVTILFYKLSPNIFIVFTFFIFCLFAFRFLDSQVELAPQWSTYINPLNQAFLFICGMVIALYVDVEKFAFLGKEKALLLLLGLLVIGFIFYPVSGDTIVVVSGWNRIGFTCLSVFIVMLTYITNAAFPSKILNRSLSILGQISYSVYMLHQIIDKPIVKIFGRLGVSSTVAYFFCVPITLLVSFLVYKNIEEPMIRVGSRISKKIKSASNHDTNSVPAVESVR